MNCLRQDQRLSHSQGSPLIAAQVMKSFSYIPQRLLIGLVVVAVGFARAQPVPPSVSTLPAGPVGATNATLNGSANPWGARASGWFEWGATTNYGNVTPAQALGSGVGITNFSHGLTNLAAGAAYHFRAVASNSFQVSFGTNQGFATSAPLPNHILFSENFDADHTANWIINSGPGANAANFFFDYSIVGIPSAPHSAGTTRGLKLEANYGGNVEGGISVSPRDQDFTNDYVPTFDIWLNFVGPAPAGGNGSTQITGAGVDTEGIAPQWGRGTKDSIFLVSRTMEAARLITGPIRWLNRTFTPLGVRFMQRPAEAPTAAVPTTPLSAGTLLPQRKPRFFRNKQAPLLQARPFSAGIPAASSRMATK